MSARLDVVTEVVKALDEPLSIHVTDGGYIHVAAYRGFNLADRKAALARFEAALAERGVEVDARGLCLVGILPDRGES